MRPSHEIDIISVTTRFQERVKRLETELQTIQADLNKLVVALSQPIAVYEVEGEQVVVTQADVEAVRAQLIRTFPEDAVRVLALVNKLEAIRNVAVSNGIIIGEPIDLMRWSLTWGLFVFLYALIWLALCFAGFFFTEPVSAIVDLMGQSGDTIWFSALAGSVGGVVNILYRLSKIGLSREFDRRYLSVTGYLIYPVAGFIIGIGMYFFMILASLVGSTSFNQNFDATGTALLILISCIAGFRQEDILAFVEVGVQRLLKLDKPKTEASSKLASHPDSE